MKQSMRWSVLALVLVGARFLIGWRFNSDMAQARERAAEGAVLLQTRCGPIEVRASLTISATHTQRSSKCRVPRRTHAPP